MNDQPSSTAFQISALVFSSSGLLAAEFTVKTGFRCIHERNRSRTSEIPTVLMKIGMYTGQSSSSPLAPSALAHHRAQRNSRESLCQTDLRSPSEEFLSSFELRYRSCAVKQVLRSSRETAGILQFASLARLVLALSAAITQGVKKH